MSRPRAQIVLEIEPGTDPIAGILRAGELPGRPFCGWTALFGALRLATDELGMDRPAPKPEEDPAP